MKKKVAESIHAYTPGLEIKRSATVRKVRRLPIPGEVLVKEGAKVSFDTVVARTYLPGNPFTVRASNILGIEPYEIEKFMKKKVGDEVEKGEVIAEYSSFFGLSRRIVQSPCKGTIESISPVTGTVILRGAPIPVEVKAYISGKVVEVMPNQGAVIETNAAFIQGIFGFGGETHGDVEVIAESPDDVLTEDQINNDHKGKILVGGSLVTRKALERAREVGASGVVTGGIDARDMTEFLGYEIGVGITGHEEAGLTVVITEGFGKMRMARRTFEILKSFDGHHAAMSGATQIRAGVLRPEIIIPHQETAEHKIEDESRHDEGIKVGSLVRIISGPYFGRIGKVSRLPVELERIETESLVRVLEVVLEDGKKVIVPRANVEIIEVE